MEAAIHTSKVAEHDSLTVSCSEELGTVVIIIVDTLVSVLMTTGSSPRKTVRTGMLLMLSTL